MFNHIRNFLRRIFHLGNPYCPVCNQHLHYPDLNPHYVDYNFKPIEPVITE